MFATFFALDNSDLNCTKYVAKSFWLLATTVVDFVCTVIARTAERFEAGPEATEGRQPSAEQGVASPYGLAMTTLLTLSLRGDRKA